MGGERTWTTKQAQKLNTGCIVYREVRDENDTAWNVGHELREADLLSLQQDQRSGAKVQVSAIMSRRRKDGYIRAV